MDIRDMLENHGLRRKEVPVLGKGDQLVRGQLRGIECIMGDLLGRKKAQTFIAETNIPEEKETLHMRVYKVFWIEEK